MSGRTVVTGGTVATDYGVFEADVAIADGRIVGLGIGLARGADEVIDAAGLTVLPGAVDLHAHFEDPGHTEREDFATGTMAAAAGGVTTVVEHPLTYPPVTTVELYREKRGIASSKAVVDFGLWGALTEPSLPEIPGQVAEGALGVKAFIPESEPAYPAVDDDQLLTGMGIAAEHDVLVLVHAESDDLLQAGLARTQGAGRTDVLAHNESRPPLVEEEAVHRTLFLAEAAGCRIQIVHGSSPRSVDLVVAARGRGVPATIEVCPHHLLLDLDDQVRLGPYGRCAPALRDRPLVEGMWERVLDGRIDCLVSDHCAYTLAEKEPGWADIFAAPLGCQVMQEMVACTLSEALERGMPLDAFARFSAANPARIARLFGRKGTIRPGADADLALWDLDAPWTVDARAQQRSKNPWSPFEGREVRCRLRRTLVRGETVFADGEILAAPGSGRFLTRSAQPVAA